MSISAAAWALEADMLPCNRAVSASLAAPVNTSYSSPCNRIMSVSCDRIQA